MHSIFAAFWSLQLLAATLSCLLVGVCAGSLLTRHNGSGRRLPCGARLGCRHRAPSPAPSC